MAVKIAKTQVVRSRINPDRKLRVSKILNKLGPSHSEAIKLFYAQVEIQEGFPFVINIPNALTALVLTHSKQVSKPKDVMELLIESKSLPLRYKDHPMKGNWIGSRDCHIGSDWILIYTITSNSIRFERTGRHSELF